MCKNEIYESYITPGVKDEFPLAKTQKTAQFSDFWGVDRSLCFPRTGPSLNREFSDQEGPVSRFSVDRYP